MKVLHLTPYFGTQPMFGGIGRFVSRLSTAQRKLGCEVTVMAPASRDDHDGGELANGVHLVTFTTGLDRLGRLMNLRIAPKSFWALRTVASGQDVIHVHGTRTFQSAVLTVFLRSLDSLVVLQPHGTFPYPGGKVRSKLIFDSVFGNKLYASAKSWIALTYHESREIQKRGVDASKIRVIPNCIDAPLVIPDISKEEFARRFDLSHIEAPWLLYLGRLHETKGLGTLLDTFRRVRSEFANAQLLIIGPKDESSVIPDLDHSHSSQIGVHWLGTVSESDKFDALKLVEALVTPSFYGFPTTFLEAMAIGTPVVTCSGYGLEQELKDVVTFADSPESLGSAITSLLSDPERITRIRLQSRDFVMTRFETRLVAEMHVSLYHSLVTAG